MSKPTYKSVQWSMKKGENVVEIIRIHKSENGNIPTIELSKHSLYITCPCGNIAPALLSTGGDTVVIFRCDDREFCGKEYPLTLTTIKLKIQRWD